jgi:hypothetical protein
VPRRGDQRQPARLPLPQAHLRQNASAWPESAAGT